MTTNQLKIKPLFSEEEIRERVTALAKQISGDMQDPNNLTAICVLNGAFIFAADLIRAINPGGFAVDFIRASSYLGEHSTGTVCVSCDLKQDIRGRDILLIEDILDTGHTLSALIRHFQDCGARTVKTAVLLDKPSRRVADITADYRCFEIPDDFVVGYGLDYNEQFRGLPYIGIVQTKTEQKNGVID